MAKRFLEALIERYQIFLQELDKRLENKEISPEEHGKITSEIVNQILEMYEKLKKLKD